MNLFKLLILLLIPLASAADTEPRKAFFSGHPDWPPYQWEYNGEILGIGTDIVRLVFTELGIDVEFVPMGNWARVQETVKTGELDGIVGLYQTSERREYLTFTSLPYMHDHNVIWVWKGNEFQFNQWEDLIGKIGLAAIGESYGQEFDRFIDENLNVMRVSHLQQVYLMLERGRADYFPFSLNSGTIQLKRLGLADKMVYLPQPFSQEDVYLALSQKSGFVEYLPQIEAIIHRLKASGKVEELVDKNIQLYLSQIEDE